MDNLVSKYSKKKRRLPIIPTPTNMPKKALLYSIFIPRLFFLTDYTPPYLLKIRNPAMNVALKER
tara:strand:- start:710 stop:904 length:195 start_codon:yes stop_codon:yes gene_type:complete